MCQGSQKHPLDTSVHEGGVAEQHHHAISLSLQSRRAMFQHIAFGLVIPAIAALRLVVSDLACLGQGTTPWESTNLVNWKHLS